MIMELPIGEWKVRSWQTDDAPALLKYANNARVWINLRDSFPYPYTEADARAWLGAALLQIPETAFAIASADEAIGGISVQPQYDVYRKSAEIGYWLGEPFWGKGIATSAVRVLTSYAFTRLDLQRIYASVFAWNPASARVLEKAGYHLEGRMRDAVYKNGKLTDQLLYGITRADLLARR
jgi:[ribosomal protein S5]-alanine N-acetyltransferase